MSVKVEERLKNWLQANEVSDNTIVMGDLSVWNAVEQEGGNLKILHKTDFSEENKSQWNKNLSELGQKIFDLDRCLVLAIEGSELHVMAILRQLKPYSHLVLCNSKELTLQQVDLYSTIHFNNLIVEVI